MSYADWSVVILVVLFGATLVSFSIVIDQRDAALRKIKRLQRKLDEAKDYNK